MSRSKKFLKRSIKKSNKNSLNHLLEGLYSLLLEHTTTIKGLINILKSSFFKTPKRTQVKSWSKDFVFFRFVKEITKPEVSTNFVNIYIKDDIRDLLKKSNDFFIHPTSNIYGPLLNENPENCKCHYEYITPKLENRLELETKTVNKRCRVSFSKSLKLLEFDKNICDGGNEIGFVDKIPITKISFITIYKKDLDKIPKLILNLLDTLEIKLITF